MADETDRYAEELASALIRRAHPSREIVGEADRVSELQRGGKAHVLRTEVARQRAARRFSELQKGEQPPSKGGHPLGFFGPAAGATKVAATEAGF